MGNKPSFMLQDEEITTISNETGFSPAQIERLYSRFTALDKSGNGSLSRQDFLAIPELAINPLCDRIVHMFFITCDDDHERINFRQFMNVLATFRSSNKSSPLTRSRNVSRHDSLNRQQEQSIMKQAPLLFDSIDPSSLSALSKHHARRSSFPDAFYDGFHHTTNQHSIHYASSSGQISQLTNGFQYLNHYLNAHNKNQQPVCREPLNSQKQKLYFMFKIYDVNNDNLVDLEDLVSILKMMVGTYVDDARIRRIAERSLHEADKDYDGFINFDEFCAIFLRKDIGSALRVTFRIHSNL